MLKVMSEFLPDKPVKLYLDVTDFDEISEEDLKYRRLWRQWHTRMARMRQGLEPSVYSHYHDGHGELQWLDAFLTPFLTLFV